MCLFAAFFLPLVSLKSSFLGFKAVGISEEDKPVFDPAVHCLFCLCCGFFSVSRVE